MGGKKNLDVNCQLLYISMWNIECDMCTIHCQWGVPLFAAHRFDYDKLLLAYGIKKRIHFIFYWILRNDLLKMNSVANRGLRIGGAHNRSMEGCAWKQFFSPRPNIESSIKVCHKTSLNWDFSWLNDKAVFWWQREKLIGSKEVEHFLSHRWQGWSPERCVYIYIYI